MKCLVGPIPIVKLILDVFHKWLRELIHKQVGSSRTLMVR